MPIPAEDFERGGRPHEEPELEYRLNPTTHSCKVCDHPDREIVDDLFMRKEITGTEAARRLGVTPPYYGTHIHRDIQRQVKENVSNSPIIAKAVTSTIEKVRQIDGIFSQLVDRAEVLLKQPLDAKAEFRIKAMTSEIRAYGEFLMKIEGTLKDSPLIVINQLKLEFTQVLELVMAEAPPTLKRKIVDLLSVADLEAMK